MALYRNPQGVEQVLMLAARSAYALALFGNMIERSAICLLLFLFSSVLISQLPCCLEKILKLTRDFGLILMIPFCCLSFLFAAR